MAQHPFISFFRQRPCLAAFLLGGVLTLSAPPLGLFPVFFAVIPLFMALLASLRDGRTAFLAGWAFGGGYFICGVYWMAVAFAALYDTQPWLLLVAVFGVPLYIAFTYALAARLAYAFRHEPALFALAFAAFFSVADILRTLPPTNFPWLLPGAIWYHVPALLQAVSVVGIAGLTALTLFWATLPFLFFSVPRPQRLVRVLAASFLVVALGGAVRLWPASVSSQPDVALRILQPNITQAEKAQDAYRRQDKVFERHLDMMSPPPAAPASLTVWPESVFAATPDDAAARFARIGRKLSPKGYAAVGFHRHVEEEGKKKVYNSLAIVDSSGRAQAVYDKARLVPWGEYVPLESVTTRAALAPYLQGMKRMSRGPGLQTLHIGPLPPFSPLICFESIFSGGVARGDDRPSFLLLVTDHEWSRRSAGPWQHDAFTRLRAIEEGLPVVVAGNIGVSSVVDPYGRVIHRLGVEEVGVIESDLPAALPPTLFSRAGNAPTMAGLGLIIICLIIYRRNKPFTSCA